MVRLARPLTVAAILGAGQANFWEPGNSLASFRDDPEQFFSEWKATAQACPETMDGTLYSKVDGQSTWTDYLYPFQFEKDFRGAEFTQSTRGVWWVSYVVVSLYLVLLWAGTSMMKDKQPFDLKTPLAVWNLFLAVFSFLGAARTVPHLAMMFQSHGFQYTICRRAGSGYGCGASGFWVALFIYSKYFELIDTAFLVVRKKKVGFLHWYHHCSVLLYCAHSYMWEMPSGIYFVSMNYSVHAVMYLYYFLAAVCKKPPKWALAVTIMQLTQMAIGIFVTVAHVRAFIYKDSSVPYCDGHIPNLTAALGMYASYFLLFLQFFIARYCKPRSSSSKAAKKLQ